MPEFHLPFAAEDRGVAAELQAALVDLIDLALIGEQAHWNIAGPHFAGRIPNSTSPPTRRAGPGARGSIGTGA